MEKWILPILLLIASGCSSVATSDVSEASQDKTSSLVSQLVKPVVPRTYWPLDYTVQKHSTTIRKPFDCQITIATKCLNDSLVMNQVVSDAGPVLDILHNYESLLSVKRGTIIWQQARLTKQLFRYDSSARKLGPLATLILSHTSFAEYRAPDFYFITRLGVPDSDIFIEAEVALMPSQKIRLIKVRKQAESG